ncbi:MAG: 4-hydroxy-3-methylbut-2-enyl diphosphate reductase [Acholeplasmatales bacterium]
MIINDLRPRGYCHGVKRALKIVKEAALDDNLVKPIYILGLIVHNKKIKEALENYGVISLEGKTRLEMAKKVTKGTVILTAHGTALNVKKVLEEKNINVIDATCFDVYKVHKHILEKLDNHEVLYIGKPFHPEVEGVLGLSNEITLISSLDDAKNFIKKTNKPIYITNQTTLSLYDINPIIDCLKERFLVTFDNDICLATTKRQEAVINQSKADLLFVVGDKLSSNTNKLKEVSLKNGIPCILIEGVEEINPLRLKDIKSINVTSGASTPDVVTDEVINYLKQFDYNKKETWVHVSNLTNDDILKI